MLNLPYIGIVFDEQKKGAGRIEVEYYQHNCQLGCHKRGVDILHLDLL